MTDELRGAALDATRGSFVIFAPGAERLTRRAGV